MSGRFTLIDPDRLATFFSGFHTPEFSRTNVPRYSIAPGQAILGVRNDRPDAMTSFKWGFHGRVNMRAEALIDPRDPIRRRCLIFADGFYEWKGDKPFHFTLKSGEPFAVGGIWEPGGNAAAGAVVLTCDANSLVNAMNPRMPAIVPAGRLDAWLAPEPLSEELVRELTTPCDAGLLQSRPVSVKLNDATYDAPDVLVPEIEQTSLF